MIKKIIKYLILFSFIDISYANNFKSLFKSPQSGPTSVGKNGPTIAKLSESCQKFQNVQQIAQVYIPHIAPVVGFPGVAFGLIQYRSAIIDVCDYIIKLDRVDGFQAVLLTESFLNNLSANKFNDHLALQDLWFNTANSIYDFQGDGGFRKGALTSASTHRSLVRLADETAKFYQKHGKGESNPEGIEDKNERQRKLNDISRLAYKRAILTDALSCPETPDKKDKLALYNREVTPKVNENNDLEEDRKIIRGLLIDMGKEFLVDLNDYNKYIDDVYFLVNSTVRFTAKPKRLKETTTSPTAKYDKEGYPVKKNSILVKTVNIFSVSVNDTYYTNFLKLYRKKWEDWVTSQMFTTGTFGLLTGKKGKVESKFRDYSYECSNNKLKDKMKIKDRNDSRYDDELGKLRQECRDNLKVRKNEYENLMEFYVSELKKLNIKIKKNTADIWNFEAEQLGVVRTINQNNSQDLKSTQTETVSCSTDLQPAEMQQANLELDSIRLEMKQQRLESMMKKQQIKEDRYKAEGDDRKKFKQDNKQFFENMKKKEEIKMSMPISSPKSGI